MSLKTFAERYRVKIINTGAEHIAPGTFGEISDSYGDGLLSLRLLAVPRHARLPIALASRARKAEAAGMTAHQRADTESIWLFRPENDAHCRLAVKLVGARVKRTLSPEAREAAAIRLAEYRQRSRMPSGMPFLGEKPSVEGPLANAN